MPMTGEVTPSRLENEKSQTVWKVQREVNVPAVKPFA